MAGQGRRTFGHLRNVRRLWLFLEIALVRSQTIEQTCTASTLQGFLTATPRGVRRVPRGVAAAVAVVMADLGAALAITRPAVACVIDIVGGVSRSVFPSARQHVVLIRGIAAALHRIATFVQGGPLNDIRADVKFIEDGCDQLAKGILPGADPDSVSRGDSPRTVCFCTEVRPPGATADTSSFSESLAVAIRTF